MESDLHAQMKRMASAWMHAADASAVAFEVRTAIPFWRADVAAWFCGNVERLEARDRMSRAEVEAAASPPRHSLWQADEPLARLQFSAGAVDLFGQPLPRPEAGAVRRMMDGVHTVLVECKVSRADFLSDGDDLEAASAEHARLHARLRRMQAELLPRWEPHLQRRGETLFEQTDGWNVERSRLQSVREARQSERLAREAMRSRVKFDRMSRWRLADRLYLCCPAGLVKPTEVPERWGLLEVTRGAIRLRRLAPPLGSPATRRWLTVQGVQRSSRRSP
jgi:hypothetical protein